MKRKTTAVLLGLALLAVAVLVGVAVAVQPKTGPDREPGRDACKERLMRAYDSGEVVESSPRECVGLSPQELQQITGEILTEEGPY